MGTYVQNVPVRFKRDTVVVGTPYLLDTMGYPFPISVTAIPGSGGTMSVYFSTTPNAAGNDAGSTWQLWDSGDISAITNDVALAPIAALKFVASTASGFFEVNA